MEQEINNLEKESQVQETKYYPFAKIIEVSVGSPA